MYENMEAFPFSYFMRQDIKRILLGFGKFSNRKINCIFYYSLFSAVAIIQTLKERAMLLWFQLSFDYTPSFLIYVRS